MIEQLTQRKSTRRRYALATALSLALGTAGATAPDSHARAKKYIFNGTVDCLTQETHKDTNEVEGTFKRCVYKREGKNIVKITTESNRTYQTVNKLGQTVVDKVLSKHYYWTESKYGLPPRPPLHVGPYVDRKVYQSGETPVIAITPDSTKNIPLITSVLPTTPEATTPMPPLNETDEDFCYGYKGDEVACTPDQAAQNINCIMEGNLWENPTPQNPNGQCLPYDASLDEAYL